MSESNGIDVFGMVRSASVRSNGSVDGSVLKVFDADQFPVLTRLMTSLPDDTKGDIKPAKLAVFVQRGVLTVCVNVPCFKRHAFIGCEGFATAFEKVDLVLKSGDVEWHEDKPYKRF